ncbi:ACT domain-containing protein [Mucilaginibacter sp. E4BP6]|uniref:ACT domain-containing protein n=1 Tax=Mucilaginibacter sp. E4BP6 TaxID=2723089 RepID=UPI0015C73B5E|nr:ACT domain-containing protein [Mucilaginibacter sp. E4BP6]NYE67048.1 hypothetical protein [Mucilaginibacter sp. E4BP6]
MSGVTDIGIILKTMSPQINEGEYVFCTVDTLEKINIKSIIGIFKEEEGVTVILKKKEADTLTLSYSYISAWITLNIHSSLEAFGLTAAVSVALAKENVSCNVIAAFFHDHIFVDHKQAENALAILKAISKNYNTE